MNLLHIDSSITGANSASRQLSAASVAALKAAIPGLEVIRRDLDANPIPHLDSKRLPTVRPANAPEGAVGIADEGGSDVLDEFLNVRKSSRRRTWWLIADSVMPRLSAASRKRPLTAAAWKARSAAKGGKGVFGSAMAWEVSRRHDFLSSHESYSAASSPPRSAACWGATAEPQDHRGSRLRSTLR